MQEFPVCDAVESAIGKLSACLHPKRVEQVPPLDAFDRILASPVFADRPSPAVDVSAMDGYAIRIADFSGQELPVIATTIAGHPPETLKPQTAIQVFTGAATPVDADCVIRREDCIESPASVQIRLHADELRAFANIRRCGENCEAGREVLSQGQLVSSGRVATLASFSPQTISVFQRPKVAVVNTGDELIPAGQPVELWQIRDSNGPLLESFLRSNRWLEFGGSFRVGDCLDATREAIRDALQDNDAVIITGGVSMGDTDFVPEALQQLGAETIFHRLPIRPGKPILGAHLNGKLILGLPGNPVSVAVTSRIFGLPLLKKLAGWTELQNPVWACLESSDSKTLSLHWYRLVVESNIKGDPKNFVQLAPSRGSGDIHSLGCSDGFVHIPPGEFGEGPWQYYRW